MYFHNVLAESKQHYIVLTVSKIWSINHEEKR